MNIYIFTITITGKLGVMNIMKCNTVIFEIVLLKNYSQPRVWRNISTVSTLQDVTADKHQLHIRKNYILI